jgi:lipopolysaccharide export system protein LptA
LAEKADRYQPLNLAADRQGTLDMVKKTAVFTGNVVITKGSIVIEADRVEIRELPNGTRHATAYGSKTQQATFKQKRDQPNESVFGKADQLEYDEKTDTVRFVSRALAQRLVADRVVDEITGDILIYDNQAEVFSAASSATPNRTGGGRVRVILAPRETEPLPAQPVSPPSAPDASRERP